MTTETIITRTAIANTAVQACPFRRGDARRALYFAAISEAHHGVTETRLRTMREGAALGRLDFDFVIAALETRGLVTVN